MRAAACVLVLALALASTARANTIDYTFYNVGTYTESGYSLPLQQGALTLDFDRNRDGLSGDIQIAAGSVQAFHLTGVGFGADFFSYDYFALALLGSGGATGTLVGHEIFWDPGAAFLSHSRTDECSGGTCGRYGYPHPDKPVIEAPYRVSPDMGRWILSDDLTQILATTRAVFSTGSPVPGDPSSQPIEWLVFAPVDLGFVPEPNEVALLLVALGAIAARQRAAMER